MATSELAPHLAVGTCLLLGCMGAASVVKRFPRVHNVIGECAVFILTGLIFGLVLGWTRSLGESISFQPAVVMYALLPLLIFDAAFSMNIRRFFNNIGTIALLAFAGTMINCVLFAVLLFGLSSAGATPLMSMGECMLFGAVVSTTDPVATLAIMGAPDVGVPPLLYTLVLGESVLNDAVGMGLSSVFRGSVPYDEEGQRIRQSSMELPPAADVGDAVRSAVAAISSVAYEDSSLAFGDVVGALMLCLGLALTSAAFGCAVGLVLSAMLRHMHRSNEVAPSPSDALQSGASTAESAAADAAAADAAADPMDAIHALLLVGLFAIFSFVGADAVGLSPVMSVFFFGLTMAWCGVNSLPAPTAALALQASKLGASFADTLAFASLGASTGLSMAGNSALKAEERNHDWSAGNAHTVGLVIATLVLCVLVRAAHVFPLLALANRFRTAEKQISRPMRICMWLSGLRGPVSLLLSFEFPGPNGLAVRTATLVLVLVSVFFGGGSTHTLLQATGMMQSPEQQQRERERRQGKDPQHKQKPQPAVQLKWRQNDSPFVTQRPLPPSRSPRRAAATNGVHEDIEEIPFSFAPRSASAVPPASLQVQFAEVALDDPTTAGGSSYSGPSSSLSASPESSSPALAAGGGVLAPSLLQRLSGGIAARHAPFVRFMRHWVGWGPPPCPVPAATTTPPVRFPIVPIDEHPAIGGEGGDGSSSNDSSLNNEQGFLAAAAGAELQHGEAPDEEVELHLHMLQAEGPSSSISQQQQQQQVQMQELQPFPPHRGSPIRPNEDAAALLPYHHGANGSDV